jgi:flagellin
MHFRSAPWLQPIPTRTRFSLRIDNPRVANGNLPTPFYQATRHGLLDDTNDQMGEAISLNQTQGSFLRRVQEALERMKELSILAQSSLEQDRAMCKGEFLELQQRIKDIGAKMYDAGKTFQSVRLEIRSSDDESAFGNTIASLVNETIEQTFDPRFTSINDCESASAAACAIHTTLESVLKIQGRVESNLQKLNAETEQLSPPRRSHRANMAKIPNFRIANENTHSICAEILVKSGTVMLAQANALPELALHLLQ